MLWLAVLLSALCFVRHGVVVADVRLLAPPQRSSMWRFGHAVAENKNDGKLNCGGFEIQWNGTFCCRLCGDPCDGDVENEAPGKYVTSIIPETYDQGSVIPARVELFPVQQLGYMEFRLCALQNVDDQVTQACLDKHLLPIQEAGGKTSFYPGSQAGNFSLSLQLPETVTCLHCVLQMKYVAGNRDPDASSACQCLGCGKQEHFFNCADIKITVPAVSGSQTTTDSSATTTSSNVVTTTMPSLKDTTTPATITETTTGTDPTEIHTTTSAGTTGITTDATTVPSGNSGSSVSNGGINTGNTTNGSGSTASGSGSTTSGSGSTTNGSGNNATGSGNNATGSGNNATGSGNGISGNVSGNTRVGNGRNWSTGEGDSLAPQDSCTPKSKDYKCASRVSYISDLWCLHNCVLGNCNPMTCYCYCMEGSSDQAAPPPPPLTKSCKAATDPLYDVWCETNYVNQWCPSMYCRLVINSQNLIADELR